MKHAKPEMTKDASLKRKVEEILRSDISNDDIMGNIHYMNEIAETMENHVEGMAKGKPLVLEFEDEKENKAVLSFGLGTI